MDIEGEDNQVVGEDALDEDDSVVKSSQDVDTTILFTKPITNYGDVAFGELKLHLELILFNFSITLEYLETFS